MYLLFYLQSPRVCRLLKTIGMENRQIANQSPGYQRPQPCNIILWSFAEVCFKALLSRKIYIAAENAFSFDTKFLKRIVCCEAKSTDTAK
jgi:hypothetical protein